MSAGRRNPKKLFLVAALVLAIQTATVVVNLRSISRQVEEEQDAHSVIGAELKAAGDELIRRARNEHKLNADTDGLGGHALVNHLCARQPVPFNNSDALEAIRKEEAIMRPRYANCTRNSKYLHLAVRAEDFNPAQQG